MNRIIAYCVTAGLACAVAGQGFAAGSESPRPIFDEYGVVQVPAFELPPSGLMSPEAREFQKLR